jgi:hypothetical protein
MNDLKKLLSALAGRSCTGALRDLMDAGFFTRVLPEVQTMKGVTQDFYHSDDVWEHTLKTMEVVERILEEPAEFIAGMDRVRGMINRYLDAGRRRTTSASRRPGARKTVGYSSGTMTAWARRCSTG